MKWRQHMKLHTIFSATALAILLGISAPVYAQQDEPRPQDEKRVQPDEKAAHGQDKQEDKQMEKDKEGKQVDREKDNRHVEQEDKSARRDQRADQGERREGKTGGHIPDDRFRANFGHEH